MKCKIPLITTFVFIFSLVLMGQQQTSDGGYIIAGTTESYVHSAGYSDILVYKLTAAGSKQWRKNFGGADNEHYGHVIQTSDGGYAVCGTSWTYTHGEDDFIVYKLSATGAKEWRKNYGGAFTERGGFIQPTADGGYILCGVSDTYTNGGGDYIVYKLDAAGKKEWRKNYGGFSYDEGRVIRQTFDGGYIVAGHSFSYYTQSTGGKTIPLPPPPADMLVYKLDAAGNKVWRKSYGGSGHEECHDIRQTADGGYIIIGETRSYNQTGSDYDFLVYRVDAAGTKLWRKNYGGDMNDFGFMCFATADGGYLLFGDSESYATGPPYDSDLLVYKVDSAGAKQWRKHYGGVEVENAFPK